MKTRKELELEEKLRKSDKEGIILAYVCLLLFALLIIILVVAGLQKRNLQTQLSECQDDLNRFNNSYSYWSNHTGEWHNYVFIGEKYIDGELVFPLKKSLCDSLVSTTSEYLIELCCCQDKVPDCNNKSWEENVFNLTFKPSWWGYLEDEIPKDYIKLVIYEESCWTDGSNCVYYKKEVYFPENYEVLE